MKIVFADRGWEDFTYWVEHDRKIAARIVRLIKDIEREPFKGLGKPEPLQHDLTGFWCVFRSIRPLSPVIPDTIGA